MLLCANTAPVLQPISLCLSLSLLLSLSLSLSHSLSLSLSASRYACSDLAWHLMHTTYQVGGGQFLGVFRGGGGGQRELNYWSLLGVCLSSLDMFVHWPRMNLAEAPLRLAM